jgi:hypothetical protein
MARHHNVACLVLVFLCMFIASNAQKNPPRMTRVYSSRSRSRPATVRGTPVCSNVKPEIAFRIVDKALQGSARGWERLKVVKCGGSVDTKRQRCLTASGQVARRAGPVWSAISCQVPVIDPVAPIAPVLPPELGDEFQCSCILIYDPVCGVDGVTYGNACEAGCVGNVPVAYNGECGSGAGIPPVVSPIPEAPPVPEDCICAAIYAPVCGIDGITYSNPCEAGCKKVAVASDGECPTGAKRRLDSFLA